MSRHPCTLRPDLSERVPSPHSAALGRGCRTSGCPGRLARGRSAMAALNRKPEVGGLSGRRGAAGPRVSPETSRVSSLGGPGTGGSGQTADAGLRGPRPRGHQEPVAGKAWSARLAAVLTFLRQREVPEHFPETHVPTSDSLGARPLPSQRPYLVNLSLGHGFQPVPSAGRAGPQDTGTACRLSEPRTHTSLPPTLPLPPNLTGTCTSCGKCDPTAPDGVRSFGYLLSET